MKPTTARTEDSFEKARRTFFGNANAKSSQSAPATGAITPRNEPPREVAGQMTAAEAR